MGNQQNCEKNGFKKQHHRISKKRDIIPQKWAVSKIVRREEERVQKWAVSKIVRRREEEKKRRERVRKTERNFRVFR